MRTFIAIELPEHIKAKIFKEFEKIKESGLVSGNFVEKENIHLTLKFLGEISNEEIEKIKKKLSEVKFKEFVAEIGKIGVFPHEKHINVVWVELLSEKDGIKTLYEEIEKKLAEIGIKEDIEREFQSHITVLRVKSVRDKDMFLQKLKKIKIKKEGFIINGFSLIKSELMRSGPVYKVIEKFGA